MLVAFLFVYTLLLLLVEVDRVDRIAGLQPLHFDRDQNEGKQYHPYAYAPGQRFYYFVALVALIRCFQKMVQAYTEADDHGDEQDYYDGFGHAEISNP